MKRKLMLRKVVLATAAVSMLTLSACSSEDSSPDKDEKTVVQEKAVAEKNVASPQLGWESTLPKNLQKNKQEMNIENRNVVFYSDDKSLTTIPNSPISDKENIKTWVQVSTTEYEFMPFPNNNFPNYIKKTLGEKAIKLEKEEKDGPFEVTSGYYDISEIEQPERLFINGVPKNLDKLPDIYFKSYVNTDKNNPEQFLVTAHSENKDIKGKELIDDVTFKYDPKKDKDYHEPVGKEKPKPQKEQKTG